MNIYLIRHAISEGNENPFNCLKKSECDIDLSEKGVEQANELHEKHKLNLFNNLELNRSIIFSSPYLRALKTAQIAIGEKYKSRIIENPLLVERSWGSLRNKICERSHSDADFRFFNRPEGGESFFDLYQRVVLFIEFLRNYREEYDNFIIFTHGEWMKTFDMISNNTSIEEFEKTCKINKIDNCEVRKYIL
jgi:broad specificity phosphatase PhoE